MLAVTLDRFIAVVVPLRYTQFTRTRIVRRVAAAMWTISMGFPTVSAIPLLVANGKSRSFTYKVITMTSSIFSLAIAFVVIVLNALIVRYAWSAIFKGECFQYLIYWVLLRRVVLN